MWRRLFTESDRQQLDDDLETSWKKLGTVGMWMQVRDVSLERAVIDIAHGLGLMSEQTVRWLLRELGEEMSDAPPCDIRPVWDATTGELWFDHRLIRRVRITQTPSNIQQILDAFEAAGWPHRIDNILPYGPEQLHQALRSLNSSLKEIRFRSQKSGEAVVWEPR